MSEEKKPLIKSFQAIRFFLFVFIFVHHCSNLVKIEILDQSGFAVSCFIILSGFLNGYLYCMSYDKVTFKNLKDFVFKRLKKIYPLHITMLIASIGLSNVFNYKTSAEFIEFIKRLFANLFLVQSYINDQSYYFSFNGVTWFLSTYLFLTIISIPLLVLIKKIKKSKNSSIILILLSIILYTCLLTISYHLSHESISKEFYLYIFPPSRIFEYAIGMFFGSLLIFKKFSFKYDNILFTIFEILTLLVIYLFIKYVPFNDYLVVWGSKWVIPSVLLLTTFSFQKGYISKFFKIDFFVKLGNATMNMYLIHQVLINYVLSRGIGVHYRYQALYIFIITIIISLIITKYQNIKREKN